MISEKTQYNSEAFFPIAYLSRLRCACLRHGARTPTRTTQINSEIKADSYMLLHLTGIPIWFYPITENKISLNVWINPTLFEVKCNQNLANDLAIYIY